MPDSLHRPQLADEVAAHLRDRIMSGRLRPGERIRLEEVAARLGVSITPVREALLTLRGEDMVELEPRKGYVVAPLSKQDIVDLFRLQADIAGELAARVAERVAGGRLARLSTVDGALKKAMRGRDIPELERCEFEFHKAINLLAGARKLAWFLLTVTRYTPARLLSSDPAWRDGMRTDHEALLRTLAERDPAGARAAMARHFTAGADRQVQRLENLAFWTP